MLTLILRAFRAPGIALFVSMGYLLYVGVSLPVITVISLFLILITTALSIGWAQVMGGLGIPTRGQIKELHEDKRSIFEFVPPWVLTVFILSILGYIWVIIVSINTGELIVTYLLVGTIGVFVGSTLAYYRALGRGLWPPKDE